MYTDKKDVKKEQDMPVDDKFGYIILSCLVIGVLTFLTTHVFWLSPVIILFIIILMYIPLDNIPSTMKRIFALQILIPFMIITCIITGSAAWSRMNNMYEADAKISKEQKEQITKVHENIPKLVYSFKKEKKLEKL